MRRKADDDDERFLFMCILFARALCVCVCVCVCVCDPCVSLQPYPEAPIDMIAKLEPIPIKGDSVRCDHVCPVASRYDNAPGHFEIHI